MTTTTTRPAPAITAPVDAITRAHSAFGSFRELTDDTHPTYRPTIHTDSRDRVALADAYDAAMAARGDERRAYRIAPPAGRR